MTIAAAHGAAGLLYVQVAAYWPAASTTRYAGCNCNWLLALPPSWLLVKFVKLLPAVRFPCLLSMPTAPTSSSSACEVVAGVVPVHVVAVMPELGVVLFPVPAWQRSLGDGDTMPLK